MSSQVSHQCDENNFTENLKITTANEMLISYVIYIMPFN